MSFKQKIKGLVGSISNVLSVSSEKINSVIKEVSQYIDAEINVAKESIEGIKALKEYGDIETPSLKKALNSLATTFEGIENARKQKTDQLKEKFLDPLKEIIEEAKIKNAELKEAENAKKALEKAQKKVEKLEAKAEEKLKPGQLEEAEKELKEAEKIFGNEEKQAAEATKIFSKKKSEIIKKVLKNIADVEKSFHNKVVDLMNEVQEKAEQIDVEETMPIEDTKQTES